MVLPGFGTKAFGSDMMASAMVSLTDQQGNPLASGLTDASGAFTLYKPTMGFTPAAGEFYHLQIVKRMDRAGVGVLLSLQTIVKRLDQNWASISGSSIVVNLLTTAVSLYAKEDGLTAFDSVLGLVSGPDFASVTGFGSHSADAIWGRAAMLTQMLQTYQDPVTGRDGQLATRAHAGDVVIADADSLAAARAYDKIEGHLTIAAGAPADVELPDLLWVTGNVTVAGSANPARLALPSLRRVDGAMTVADQTGMTALAAGHLSVVGQAFRLASLPALASLDLAALEHVGGDCLISGLKNGTSHTLASLTSVAGKLDIGSQALSALSLPSLAQVADLTLHDLQGGAPAPVAIPRLATVHSLDVHGNTLGAVDLSGLQETTGSLTLTDNGPDAKPALGNLAKVGTDFTFATAATSADFAKLTAVGSDIRVEACPQLASLSLSKLTGVSGSVIVRQNPQLGSLKLTSLASVSRDATFELGVAGDLDIWNLATVGGDLSVQGPVTTTNLMTLTSVGGSFRLAASELQALQLLRLKGVGHTLTIESNPVLVTVSATALQTVGGDMLIRNNPKLPLCSVEMIKRLLVGFTGATDFSGNQGAGCGF
jgi:hypothetical protein